MLVDFKNNKHRKSQVIQQNKPIQKLCSLSVYEKSYISLLKKNIYIKLESVDLYFALSKINILKFRNV